MFIIIDKDKIIKGVYCGDKSNFSISSNEEIIDVPDTFEGLKNMNFNYFKKDGTKKTVNELVKDKLIKLEKDEIVVNNKIVKKEKKEKIKIPENMKLEKGKLVNKTIDDLLDDKSITVDEYNEFIKIRRKRLYESLADPLFFQYQRGEATEKEWKDKIIEIKKELAYKK